MDNEHARIGEQPVSLTFGNSDRAKSESPEFHAYGRYMSGELVTQDSIQKNGHLVDVRSTLS